MAMPWWAWLIVGLAAWATCSAVCALAVGKVIGAAMMPPPGGADEL